MIKIALIAVALFVVLFFLYVFIVALILTIKEMRHPKGGVNFEAGQKFSGELGVQLIKKGQPIPQ